MKGKVKEWEIQRIWKLRSGRWASSETRRRVASLSALITSPGVVPRMVIRYEETAKFEDVNGDPLNRGNAFNHEIRR